MQTKIHLYSLIDMLPESEIHSAMRYLELLISKAANPVLRTLLDAPYDDDDESPEKDESDAIREAENDIAEGKTQSLESVMREFGL